MKETPRQYLERTGRGYRPTAVLRRQGRPLGLDDPCPTLFRYPGPFGLARLLQGTPHRLAPDGAPWVWLADQPLTRRPGAVRLFGSLAVLQPLRLDPCRVLDNDGEEAWLGRDRSLREGHDLSWVPPSIVEVPYDWDTLREPDAIQKRLGERYDEERNRVIDALSGYVEELAELGRAGVPLPGTAWHDLPAPERARLLSAAGIHPRWTR
jgi:hypothetical protein